VLRDGEQPLVKLEIVIESEFDVGPKYLACQIGEAWRERGHELRIRAVEEPPGDPDVAFLHVDRSAIPESFVAQLGYDCPVVNGGALDIRKRRVSRQLVARGDGYDGPVIVKTDENYFGLPDESRTPQPEGVCGLAGRVVRRALRLDRRLGSPKEYEIYPRPAAVPGWIWRSRHYVVERFTPERDGEFYVLRNWLFLGDCEVGVICWSRAPIVKSTNIERYEFTDEVPDEIRARRRELGFDFGKFDWVMVDGQPILLDANKTPTVRMRTGRPAPSALKLAPGIEKFRAAVTA
jgi:hypothetical protein